MGGWYWGTRAAPWILGLWRSCFCSESILKQSGHCGGWGQDPAGGSSCWGGPGMVQHPGASGMLQERPQLFWMRLLTSSAGAEA